MQFVFEVRLLGGTDEDGGSGFEPRSAAYFSRDRNVLDASCLNPDGDRPQTRSLKLQQKQLGGPNGVRTRVSALRGPCPRPLDDGATSVRRNDWLGEEDLNLHYGVQSPASYH